MVLKTIAALLKLIKSLNVIYCMVHPRGSGLPRPAYFVLFCNHLLSWSLRRPRLALALF